MTEEQGQQPVAPQVAAPIQQQTALQAEPAKKSNVWVWLIGGCLTIVILIGVAIIGVGWWAAHKVKNAIKENQPKLEQWQKDAEEWQKSAEEMQRKADKLQRSIPEPEDLNIPIDLQ